MKEISRKTLKELYGIDLPKGCFRIDYDEKSRTYKVYSVKNDTAGCVLVGENKAVGKVLNSTYWEKRITEMLLDAQDKGEDIKITVQ